MAGFINNKRTSVGREEFLAAIPNSKGQLEPIEKELNCTRNALRDILKKFPDLQSELDDELERVKDRIVIAMMNEATDGGSRGADRTRETLLKAIARDRGFGEKLEVTGADGAPLVVLHASASLPTIAEWAKKAAAFSESQEKILDAQIEEADKIPEIPCSDKSDAEERG